MKQTTIEKFTLQTIADAAKGADLEQARIKLASAADGVSSVAGKVLKVIKRDGQHKLMIEEDNVPGFIVFADCLSDAEIVRNSKIRKGSPVAISGRLQSFGWSAVCLSDCYLIDAKKS